MARHNDGGGGMPTGSGRTNHTAASPPYTTTDLGLDGDGNHPRRLCPLFGGAVAGDVRCFLAYGGEDGTISLVVGGESSGGETQARPIRRSDDDFVRSVAVSPDGKRVVIGTDNGMTTVFAYDDYNCRQSEGDHPFAAFPKPPDDIFSQSDDLPKMDTPRPGERIFAGPSFASPVRDMQFYPLPERASSDSDDSHPYWLAIATESGFLIVDAQSEESIGSGPRYLKDEAESAHDDSGIRSVLFGRVRGSGGDSVVLSSLAMDGRLCLWDCSAASDPMKWKLLLREEGKVITRTDRGEMFGADPWDRSCAPLFLENRLYLPGEPFMQIRRLEASNGGNAVRVTQCDEPPVGMGGGNDGDDKNDDGRHRGHVDSIVCLTAPPPAPKSEGEEGDNQDYLITSGRDGRVILWRVEEKDAGTPTVTWTRQLAQLESPPTHLAWTRGGREEGECLFAACADGTLVSIRGRKNLRPSGWRPPTAKTQSVSAGEKDAIADPPPVKDDVDEDDGGAKLDAEDDDLKGERSEGMTTKKNKFVLEEAADDYDDVDDGTAPRDDNAPSGPVAEERSAPSQRISPAKGNGDDDDDLERPEFHEGEDDGYDDPADTAATTSNRYGTAAVDLPKQQPAFAPSSTPLDLPRRFLCWNHVGSIIRRQGGADGAGTGDLSTVDVQFTNSAFRRPITFTDNQGFILGSLGEDGGIFATDLADDEDDDEDFVDAGDDDVVDVVRGLSAATKAAVKRSRRNRASGKDGTGASAEPTGSGIYFHMYETSVGALRDKDWYLTLPDGERALGCATGEGWAAVATSRRFLRFFSCGGNQGLVHWLGGDPVTMVGRGRFLAVFIHDGAPIRDGTQKLAYQLWDATSDRVLSSGPVSCLGCGSALSWAGFSNDGSLLAMDEDGMLSMLVHRGDRQEEYGGGGGPSAALPCAWTWVPALDTVGLRKSSDDGFWPVTVRDGRLVCVPLKGGTRHPDAARRPVTTVLNLRIPLARGTLPKCNALEEVSLRADIALGQQKILHDLSEIGDDEEDFEKEYRTLSAKVDKVTLKLFAATVEAGKLERALDLVDRLHLEKSFDLAMRIADNHRTLVDLIEEAAQRKFGGPPPEEDPHQDHGDVDSDGNYAHEQGIAGVASTGRGDGGGAGASCYQRISPDTSSSARKAKKKRSFGDADGTTVGRNARPRVSRA